MSIGSLAGPALFPMLEAYLDRIAAEGIPLPPRVKLDTSVPIAPVTFEGGLYNVTITPGVLVRISAAPSGGRLLGTA